MVNWEKITSIGANVSTIVAAITAAIALTLGYQQYKDTSEAQREADAVKLYLSYVEIQKEAAMTDLSQWKEAGFYYGNYTVVVAETIFLIQQDDTGWINAIKWMIENHSEYFSSMKCGAFNEKFISLVSSVLNKDVCVY